MKRQIKFRGKSADGKWAVGIPITTHIGTFIATEENPHVCDQYGYIEIDEFAKVDPDTIGQFTGLTDKNGVEIYEGDIVRISTRLRHGAKETQENLCDMIGIQPPKWMYGGDEIARVSYFDCAFHFIILESYMSDSVGRQEPMIHYLFPERHPDAEQHYNMEIEVIGNIYDDKIKEE